MKKLLFITPILVLFLLTACTDNISSPTLTSDTNNIVTNVAATLSALVSVGEDILPVQAVSRNKTRIGVMNNNFFIVLLILF